MKTWIKKVLGFGVASFLADLSHEMTISFIPLLVNQLVPVGQGPYFLGIIASISEFSASIIRLCSGYLTDVIAHKKILIVLGYGIAAVFSTLVGFVHSIRMILVCRIGSFVGSGLREPPRDAIIAATVDAKNYGRAFGLRSALDTFGSLLGPLVALLCMRYMSMQTIFLVSFIPGFLAVLVIIFFTQDMIITHKPLDRSISFWQRLWLLPRPFVIFLGIVIIFEIGSFNKLLLLARTQEILALSYERVAFLVVMLYALFNLTRAISELCIGWLSDYVNKFVLLALLGFGTFGLVGYLLMVPQASLVYCAGVFMMYGISTATLLTLKKVCVASMVPENMLGMGYGVMQATQGMSGLISNILIGFLWTWYSSWLAFGFVMMISCVAMVFLVIFGLIHKK